MQKYYSMKILGLPSFRFGKPYSHGALRIIVKRDGIQSQVELSYGYGFFHLLNNYFLLKRF